MRTSLRQFKASTLAFLVRLTIQCPIPRFAWFEHTNEDHPVVNRIFIQFLLGHLFLPLRSHPICTGFILILPEDLSVHPERIFFLLFFNLEGTTSCLFYLTRMLTSLWIGMSLLDPGQGCMKRRKWLLILYRSLLNSYNRIRDLRRRWGIGWGKS